MKPVDRLEMEIKGERTVEEDHKSLVFIKRWMMVFFMGSRNN